MHVPRRALLLILALMLVVVVPAATQTTEAQPPVEGVESLLEQYARDADAPLNAELELAEESEDWTVHHVLFDSTDGERVPALFALPADGDGPFPVVMVQHGLGGNKDVDYVHACALGLAQAGYATLRIDAALHGERAQPEAAEDEPAPLERLAALFGGGWRQSVIDMRRGIDFLEQRAEVDSERIGYVGMSMGAMMGGVLCGVDERIDAAVLIVGGSFGGGDGLGGRMAVIDPASFIGLMSPRPVLMLNGKNDRVVPPAWAERLYEAAGEPKRIVWYESGHTDLPQEEVAREIGEFMAEHVPVAPLR